MNLKPRRRPAIDLLPNALAEKSGTIQFLIGALRLFRICKSSKIQSQTDFLDTVDGKEDCGVCGASRRVVVLLTIYSAPACFNIDALADSYSGQHTLRLDVS
jgi:hypothetical protein